MKPKFTQKVPNGTILKSTTGFLTVLGYHEGLYACGYESHVSPEYSRDRMDVREKDIENLLMYNK